MMDNKLINLDTVINWNYSGKTDALLGNQATRAESWLANGSGILGILLYIYFFLTGAYDWAIWQYLIAALIAADLAAGIGPILVYRRDPGTAGLAGLAEQRLRPSRVSGEFRPARNGSVWLPLSLDRFAADSRLLSGRWTTGRSRRLRP